MFLQWYEKMECALLWRTPFLEKYLFIREFQIDVSSSMAGLDHEVFYLTKVIILGEDYRFKYHIYTTHHFRRACQTYISCWLTIKQLYILYSDA